MDFGQQVLATFVGTLFGFIFAIFLFLITNYIQNNRAKKNLKKHLKREFQYDISLLQEWIDEIDKILRKITASDITVYSYLKYSLFQRYFMQECFRAGIMYDLFDDSDITNLNYMLVHCDIGGEQLINSFIAQWQKQEMCQKDALAKFEFQKEQLIQYRKHLELLFKKIN